MANRAYTDVVPNIGYCARKVRLGEISEHKYLP